MRGIYKVATITTTTLYKLRIYLHNKLQIFWWWLWYYTSLGANYISNHSSDSSNGYGASTSIVEREDNVNINDGIKNIVLYAVGDDSNASTDSITVSDLSGTIYGFNTTNNNLVLVFHLQWRSSVCALCSVT